MKKNQIFLFILSLGSLCFHSFAMERSSITDNSDSNLKEVYGLPFSFSSDLQYPYVFSNGEQTLKFFKSFSSDKFYLDEEIVGVDLESQSALLNTLLVGDLKDFIEGLNKFILSGFSYHDFSSNQPGRSLYFFFMGLFSPLKDFDRFKVEVKTEFDKDNNSFISKFKIFIDNRLYRIINIHGLDEGAFLDKQTNWNYGQELYFEDYTDFVGASKIDIFYYKKRMLCAVKKLEDYSLSLNLERDFVFNSPKDFIDIICGRKYISNLWLSFLSPEKISSEKDFHLFLLGIIANTFGIKNLSSNVERGHGRPDVIFKMGLPGKLEKYIIELKASKKDENAKNLAEAAITQVESQDYLQTPSRGRALAKKIHLIGLSICLDNGNIYSQQKEIEVSFPIKVNRKIEIPSGFYFPSFGNSVELLPGD